MGIAGQIGLCQFGPEAGGVHQSAGGDVIGMRVLPVMRQEHAWPQLAERTFEFDDFSDSIDFVNAVAEVAEDGDKRRGILVEYDRTATIFTRPSDKRTEDYVTGRFG